MTSSVRTRRRKPAKMPRATSAASSSPGRRTASSVGSSMRAFIFWSASRLLRDTSRDVRWTTSAADALGLSGAAHSGALGLSGAGRSDATSRRSILDSASGEDAARTPASMVGEDAAVVDDEAQTKGWILGALAVGRVAVLS